MAEFPSLLPVATSVTRLLLLIAEPVSGLPFAGAAAVVGEAATLRDRLQALKGRDQEQKALSRRIEARLRSSLQAMQTEVDARGISQELLNGAVTEVKNLLDDVCDKPAAFVTAVRAPEDLKADLHRRGSARRANLEEKAEEFFDRLVDATADEIIVLAPSSPKFQLGALQQLLDGQDRILEGQNLLLANDRKTHAKLDDIHAAVQSTTVSQARGPLRFGALPTVAEGFVERSQFTRLLESVVAQSAERTVLVGMRGCGKSQLAAALARHCERQDWHLVAWINAQSRESILAGLSELGLILGVPTGEDLPPEKLAQRCLNALASEKASDRLVILDNVERLDDLRDVVPRGQGLRVLATTTRHSGWDGQGWDQIDVAEFDRSEAVDFLLRRTGQDDATTAGDIAEKLGDLPLAIAQAAASIKYESCTLGEYLVRLSQTKLEDAAPKLDGDIYPDGVAIVLWMAIEGVLERIAAISLPRAKIARDQLGALALLAASGVPTRWLSAATDDAGEARRALAELRNSSICQVSDDGATITIHRLQGQVFRETRTESQKKEMTAAAVGTLTAIDFDAIPQNNTQERRREVLDRVAQLRTIAEQEHSHDLFNDHQTVRTLADTLNQASILGLPQEAVSLDDAVCTACHTLNTDNTETYILHRNLAAAYHLTGKLDRSCTLLRRILNQQNLILGPNHPDTLTTRNNLAATLHTIGKLDDPVDTFEQILTTRQHILGPDHPDTLASRTNLAGAYQSVGNHLKAIALFEKLVLDHQRLHGPDHRDTLSARNNLAGAYEEAGMINEAIDAYRQVLDDRRRILGPDNPQTITTHNNLVHALIQIGSPDAIVLAKQVLAERLSSLGPDNPDTLISRSNLAFAFTNSGDLKNGINEAAKTYEESLRILGPEHPDTFTCFNNLLYVLQLANLNISTITSDDKLDTTYE
ncbi:FxSxx-COOH system tetratricopeptide repeat protein [Actinomyces sp.]|uniref:FxSxx-COOH system tetratricopeptide repeat protein n=1 Tax=Actinomyces sp. TaxID=29317 RepID=UPI0026DAD453|nr:FxSxx-COOH system tetratricopeptide repeat protein [Actinomyces sp.]MDO4901045.1 FxSxx-COOH system tetratricopeptide repeat protein [Actinomyces sp.]